MPDNFIPCHGREVSPRSKASTESALPGSAFARRSRRRKICPPSQRAPSLQCRCFVSNARLYARCASPGVICVRAPCVLSAPPNSLLLQLHGRRRFQPPGRNWRCSSRDRRRCRLSSTHHDGKMRNCSSVAPTWKELPSRVEHYPKTGLNTPNNWQLLTSLALPCVLRCRQNL